MPDKNYWPEEIWNPRSPHSDDMGMAPFVKPITQTDSIAEDLGFPDNWRDYDDSIETVSAWDTTTNPLYEAAAAANDIDFGELVDDINALGDEATYNAGRDVAEGWWQIPADHETHGESHAGQWVKGHNVFGHLGIWSGTEFHNQPEYKDTQTLNDEGETVSALGSKYDWGIRANSSTSSIRMRLNRLQDFLVEEVKGMKGESQPIIERGLKGSDYGIDGDIWEQQGLTSAQSAPKELSDDHFNFDDTQGYSEIKPSKVDLGNNEWVDAAMRQGSNDYRTQPIEQTTKDS